MSTHTLFNAPLAHEMGPRRDYCAHVKCSRTREESKAAQWIEQALQEGDLFNTQLDFKFVQTPEGHEILTRAAAKGISGVDLPALLRGVTRPDKGPGTLAGTLKALVHSTDPDMQKSHALRRTVTTSTTIALSEIRNHLIVLHSRALDAGRRGDLTSMFEWIGEAMHLIQDSYSQAHTQRDNINLINAPHPIRKVRFFGFVRRFPPVLSQAPSEHQVMSVRGTHVGDPRDDIYIRLPGTPPRKKLKPEASVAIRASREYVLMVLRQLHRPPSADDATELKVFMNRHLSSSSVPKGGSVTPFSPGQPILRYGSRGPAVQNLQMRLNAWLAKNPQMNLPLLAVDGIFGPLTSRVVRAFQRATGLSVDSVVGPQTRKRLARSQQMPTLPGLGYPRISRFIPAKYFSRPSRPRHINQIVIHITAGGSNINGTIGWFQSPSSQVSAHYVVGQDGEVVQMVRDGHIAWHAGRANSNSIGIEHVARPKRGFGRDDPGLFPTQEQYCSSAKLVQWLCHTYSIPMDRVHILGHSEVDRHTSHRGCPNAVWDWARYMDMVTGRTSC